LKKYTKNIAIVVCTDLISLYRFWFKTKLALSADLFARKNNTWLLSGYFISWGQLS